MSKDLIIDGIRVNADPSKTVLEVATKLGIYVPTLCHHKALSPYGACRLCLVEIKWKGKSSLKTACTYPAWDGEVITNSESVRRARKILLELMLAEAPGAEDIREMAVEYGAVSQSYNVHREGPDNKCIMCGLCVRTCQDVMNIGAIGFKGRGFKRTITTPFGNNSEICSTCGACVAVCPTNAISLRDITDKKIRPILSEFDSGMTGRKAMFKPFPQAVPNKPLIDKENCMYFNNDGACQVCREVCEINAIDYEMKDETMEVDVGNIILATGFKTFDAKRTQNDYGFGVYPNVLNSLELERLLNASGPTNGNLYMRCQDENGEFIISPENKLPESIAFIHCVGSRNRNYNKYCSRVCCMYSLKLAHLAQERAPEATVFEYYIDMRAYGKGYEEFYNRIKEEGINIIRGLATRIEKKDSKLVLHSENIIEGRLIEQPVDMVILSVGLESRTDAPEVAEILGIQIDEDGWFSENKRNFNSVETINPGIFIAGCCQGPKDIPDTVAQASAAAAEVLQRISKGKTRLNERDIPLEKIELELAKLSATGDE